ncbi:hypothetical protein [Parvularcula sp. IMCC14364]|uniref:hypothetical protein n=1 Tax=Parvularcula sp. IMCC14364 TaxID=3067902 RepID=UPI00274293EF|nr:hypothetical protein [Parvularcula sp. IMCC14364]
MSKETDHLIHLCNNASVALSNLKCVVSPLPRHMADCSNDLRNGRGISVGNLEYKASIIKQAATEALRCVASAHAYASKLKEESEV